MRQIFIFSTLFFFGSNSFAQIEVSNATILAGLNRSLPYAKEYCRVSNADSIFEGNFFPYVRTDGKILLVPIKKGDCSWNIVKECSIEDSLRYYGDFNYEATLTMNQHLNRIALLVSDLNCLIGISNDMQQFNHQIKHGTINVLNPKKVNPPLWAGFMLTVFLIFMFIMYRLQMR